MTGAVAAAEVDATARAIRAVRAMVIHGRLGPGQQLRQDSLAERLGLSRSPLREALRTLETEGLLEHLPNQGYFVVRLRSSEMRQIYVMRRLLETEILRSIRKPGREELARIRAFHRMVGESVARGDLTGALEANRRFHFAIFALSPLDLVTRQVERLWHQSESYRAVYLSLPEAQKRITAEHASMLRCLETHDVRRLTAIADRHRSAAETGVVALLRDEEGGTNE